MKCEHCNQTLTEEQQFSVMSCNDTGLGVTLHDYCVNNFIRSNPNVAMAEINYWRKEWEQAIEKINEVKEVLE